MELRNGNNSDSLRYVSHADKLFRKYSLGDDDLSISIVNEIANVYNSIGNFLEAERYYIDMVEISERLYGLSNIMNFKVYDSIR